MFVCSFSELEAVLHVLVGVLQSIRGLESFEDSPSLRDLSAKAFGGGCIAPSQKITRLYGDNAWNGDHFERCLGLYREWVEQFWSVDHAYRMRIEQIVKTEKDRAAAILLKRGLGNTVDELQCVQDNVIMMRRLRSPDED